MFLGHYGLAFAAKRAAPDASLGTLTFAAQWADELWPFLLLLGVETVRVVPNGPAGPLDFVSYPISHSLLTMLGWGALIGLVYYAVRHRSRAAWVIAALVVSHWVLDVIVHVPDLPLYPGGPRVGLGAWRSMPLTFVLEGIFYGGGLLLYTRTTKPIDAIGRWALWSLIAFQVIAYAAATFGPPPPSAHAVALSSVSLWLFIPWTAWIDRHRRTETRGDA